MDGGDRLLVLAPHPDDEVAGCGGLILRARDLGIPVRIAFLTNGDSNEGAFLTYRGHPVMAPSAVIAMGRTRETEAERAEGVLGVPASEISFLGYPDRGTLSIWLAHWGERPPLRGLLTRATSVPYAVASRPGAPYKGGAILADLQRVIAGLGPTKVCLSSPADRHPDHAALYLFTRVALWNLGMQPDLLPYLVHYPRWPKRARRGKVGAIEPPPALQSVLDWRTFRVPLADREIEHRALLQHRSQMRSVRRLLDRLVSSDELFGTLPHLRLDPMAAPGGALRAVLPFRAEWPRTGPGDLRLGLSVNGAHLYLEAPAPELHVGRVAIDLIGFSPNRDFAAMPKIEIRVSESGIEIFDGGVREARNRGTIARLGRILRIDLPLSLLGEPDRLLVSARSSAAHLLIDETPWRVVWLNRTRISPQEARSDSKEAKAK
ncbi:MAG TPA: PIG-L family deacetylase [Thermoanaerobaculia bacterium]|nr:PIG-L family deacetylase [Thermoanaerobaculia bacterium]